MRNKKLLAILLSAVMACSVFPAVPAMAQVEVAGGDEVNVGEGYSVEPQVNYKALEDAGKIALTPGENETAMNFDWYSKTRGTPTVKIGTTADLSGTDTKTYTGKATEIDRSTKKPDDTISANLFKGNSYKASNKVETGVGALKANTTYYYQYSDGTDTSSIYSFTTHNAKKFSALVVGDPQIGSSGDKNGKIVKGGWAKDSDIAEAHDVIGWSKSLNKAVEMDPDLSFVMSVGDQIQYKKETAKESKFSSMRERQYAAFLYPEVLRSLPLATTVGNHDSIGDDYKLHFDNPNSGDNLGETNAGCDYYYSYGDVLFIVLNSNNRNAAEHDALMKKAVASHPDAKWRVCMFHHDIYGAGISHSDGDSANVRILLAPLMDKYKIDVALTGHDHCYARSYQIVDGKAIDYGESEAVNPEGTMYICAGSSSGSKYYDLLKTQQYYLAERNADYVPSFSIIHFTDDSFKIETYDNTGKPYAKPFTIKKNTKSADRASLKELVDQENARSVSANEYTKDSYDAYANALKAAKDYLADENADYKEDGGYKLITSGYDKSYGMTGNYELFTKNAVIDNPKDILDYGSNVVGEDYVMEGTNPNTGAKYEVFKKGVSALQDKTRDNTQKVTNGKDVDKIYSDLLTASQNLRRLGSSSGGSSTVKPVTPGTSQFTDVQDPNAFFYDAVLWAVKEKIAAGTSATTFSPYAFCTRAQIVTFLWRANGSKDEGASDKFTDVAGDKYYAKAVAWAVKNGITAGTSSDKFSPNATCTRAQIVTFLYRAAGVTDKATASTFADVKNDAYYADAVAWAVNNKVTSGTSTTTFSPNDNCTRGQAVTFLYRAKTTA